MQEYLSVPEGFMDVKQAVKAWGYEDDHGTYIKKLCKKNRVQGAMLVIINGRSTWIIPNGARPMSEKRGPKPGLKVSGQ